MSEKTHEGLKWVMRAGYGARGVIYTIIGGLALLAAVKSTQASGTKDALAALRDEPYGIPALIAIGIGLLAYLVWRVAAGVKDVEDHGTDAKGLIARLGQVTTGLIHGGIGVSVLALAMSGKNSGGSSAQDWTQKLMSMPAGRYIVAAGALILLGAGIYYAYKGWSGKYKGHLARTQFTESIDPIVKVGLIIYGGILGLVAFSLGYAALTANPSQAGGLGEALQSLRGMAFGRFLLGGAGLGLIGFAVYNFVEAGYRVVPKFSDPDIRTLLD
ncbi:DUF1206 domain-containing protein [Sulfitobacter sp.]|uniref:DUF1206 domain-containing protein n=1 Tax=Sulfitobacter sp. TaxID=1903071 RepID=UPI0026384200|nr:DUF1206 domain-containing protein [Sulfitobacter sp.]|tara:strand:- start:183 stop:998 length:816 start_codon:yes stop_codon:yes gene_type:complete